MNYWRYNLAKARRRGCRCGASLLETALILPVFVLLMCGLLDFGRLLFTQMTLQHAVREAGRFAVTGRHLDNAGNPNEPYGRTNSVFRIAQQAASGVPLTGLDISSAQGGAGSAGGPGDTVTISIIHDLRLATPIIARFFPDGIYRFTVAATFKNEPFPPNQTN
jgi:hypothetical protein